MNIVSVGEITRYIKQLFDYNAALAAVFVRGEISNFKRHYSGHCYFTLKDTESTMRAVMFKSRAQSLKFQPKDGMKVIAGGRISVFERDGQYQLYVEQLMPDGIGELNLAFNQLKAKLESEGLFAEERKKSLPKFPHTIGIITSPVGAALRDIITVSKRRFAGIKIIVFPVQVQGLEAPPQITEAIRILDSMRKTDVIIVGRGGGSIEELWAFNDERVVRAISESDTPIVSAVGHQTDFTLADFAADVRAATPSQAAELVVPDTAELYKYVVSLQSILENYIRNYIKIQRVHVEKLANSRVLQNPDELLSDKKQLVDEYVNRLEQTFKSCLISKQYNLRILTEKLAILNPLAVLSRGYSISRLPNADIVHKAKDVELGQDIEIILHEGTLEARVTGIREDYHGRK